MFKITLLSALIYIGSTCGAESNTQAQSTDDNMRIEHETIHHNRGLATQLGMTPEEAIFATSRKMRSRYLNEMQLDDNQDVSPANSTPETEEQ